MTPSLIAGTPPTNLGVSHIKWSQSVAHQVELGIAVRLAPRPMAAAGRRVCWLETIKITS